MIRQVSAELLKMRTTRTFYALVGVAIGLVIVAMIPVCAFVNFGDDGIPTQGLMYAISLFVPVFALLLGILAATTEFRHGTITPTLLVTPNRTTLLLAKLFAALLLGFALGLATVGSLMLIVLIFSTARDLTLPDNELSLFIGGVVAIGLYTALGVGIGMVVRNQVGAIVGAVMYIWAIEPVASLLLGLVDSIDGILPTYGLGAVRDGVIGVVDSGTDPLDQLPAMLLFTGYVLIFLVIGRELFRRRDITA